MYLFFFPPVSLTSSSGCVCLFCCVPINMSLPLTGHFAHYQVNFAIPSLPIQPYILIYMCSQSARMDLFVSDTSLLRVERYSDRNISLFVAKNAESHCTLAFYGRNLWDSTLVKIQKAAAPFIKMLQRRFESLTWASLWDNGAYILRGRQPIRIFKKLFKAVSKAIGWVPETHSRPDSNIFKVAYYNP